MPRKKKLTPLEMEQVMNKIKEIQEQNRIMDTYPDVNKVSPNRLVPLYLMSSYLYYEQDATVFNDTDYDMMCKRIVKEWDNIDHVHKTYINIESLEAGTGYGIAYTEMMKSAAMKWLNDHHKALSDEVNRYTKNDR